MKNKVKILLCVFLISCEASLPTQSTSFFIFNNCQKSITVTTTAITQSQILGPQRVTLTDVINPKDKFLLRKINASEKVKVSNVFLEIKIKKDGVESSKNFLDDNLWKKQLNTEFLLPIEDSFFNL